jgi:hypothetical protein
VSVSCMLLSLHVKSQLAEPAANYQECGKTNL